MFTHTLPLDKNASFEVANVDALWTFGDEPPTAEYWQPLSHIKATDVVTTNNARPGGVVFFNFGSNYATAALKYGHAGELGGIYRFTARNKCHKDIIVREAPTMVVTVKVEGRTIQALSGCSGDVVFELKASVNKSIRLFEFRASLKNSLMMANKATMTNTVKCMFIDSVTILRGTDMLVRAAVPTRRAAPRNRQLPVRTLGQQVISRYSRAR